MLTWKLGLLCLARAFMAVFIDGMDCDLDCMCCKGGAAQCGYKNGLGDNYCFDGCVDGIYGHRCHNPCRGNCFTCGQEDGRPCYSCKDTFYDNNSECSKSCSVGCEGEACDDDGTCSPCKQGRYGSDCTKYCTNKNCQCSAETDCTSCKIGFYGKSNFCQTPCSPGCKDGVCYDDGSCNFQGRFKGNKCSECQSGYYEVY